MSALRILLALGLAASWQVHAIVPLGSATHVSAGTRHTCAVVSGGVQCWGSNIHGQLGNDSTASSPFPVQAIPAGSGATAVSAGDEHTCAVVNGGVKCWGRNDSSQLGNGTTTIHSLVPVVAIAEGSNATAVSAGDFTSCAVVAGGVQCWGAGPLGNFSGDSSTVPLTAMPPGSAATAVATGDQHTCVVSAGGVYCWGWNSTGELGQGTVGNVRLSPGVTIAAGSGATDVAAGTSHSCAAVAGGVQCWGSNGSGRLGNGSNNPNSILVPVTTIAAGSNATSVTASGVMHSCALVDDGVQCWGQLYTNSGYQTHLVPTTLIAAGSNVTAVDAGAFHTCAIVAGGVKCQGKNTFGQLGNFTYADSGPWVDVVAAPDPAPDPFSFVSQIGVPATTTRTSNEVTPAGYTDATSISVDNGEYSIGCNGSFTGDVGSINPGESVCVQHLSAAMPFTTTTTTLTIGGVQGTFASTTGPPEFVTINVVRTGSGAGVVASVPAGAIDCGLDCSESLLKGTDVLLQAVPSPGSHFAGWSAGTGSSTCTGLGDSCAFNLTANSSVTASFELDAPVAPPRSGFNGDARSDVLWRNTSTGQVYQWQMNGLALSGQGYLPSVPTNWMVGGIGDVSGDGIADVLWREAAGLNYLWIVNGLGITSQGYLPSVPNPWIVAGLGDASGDGKADVFWRNPTTGQNYLWIMNGLSITSQGYLPSVAGSDWEMVGVADYSGDGKADALWRNKATGQNYLWVMNGLAIASQGFLPSVAGSDWEVVGSPDANGDARADVLWRHKVTGQNYLWVMNGLSITSQGYLPGVADVNWKVAGYGDYNGDSRGDVLWRNATTGQNYVWTLNGISVASQGFLPSVSGADWQPVKR